MLKRLGLGAAIAAALIFSLHFYGAKQHSKGYKQAQTEHAAAVAQAEIKARRIERELTEKMEVLDRETQQKLEQVAIAERSAADERVRSAAEEYAARYRRASALATATAERQAADTAIRMFAELLSQTDDMAGIYAAEADRRRIAGLACEAAYAHAQMQ